MVHRLSKIGVLVVTVLVSCCAGSDTIIISAVCMPPHSPINKYQRFSDSVDCIVENHGGTVLLCDAEEFKFCNINEKGVNKCLAQNIQAAVRSLKSAHGEHGLDSLDPIKVPAITIEAGSAVKLVQNYKNVEIHGLTDITVKKVHFDADKKSLLFECHFPKLQQKGQYEVNGQLLALPVTGSGQSTLILENVDVLVHGEFEDAEKFCRVKTVDVVMTPKKMTVNFENLFNGDKLLGDNINAVANDNWPDFYKDVQDSVQREYAGVFKKYAQKYFDKIPCGQVFRQE